MRAERDFPRQAALQHSAYALLKDFAAVAGRRGIRAACYVAAGSVLESLGASLLVPLLDIVIGHGTVSPWLAQAAAEIFLRRTGALWRFSTEYTFRRRRRFGAKSRSEFCGGPCYQAMTPIPEANVAIYRYARARRADRVRRGPDCVNPKIPKTRGAQKRNPVSSISGCNCYILIRRNKFVPTMYQQFYLSKDSLSIVSRWKRQQCNPFAREDISTRAGQAARIATADKPGAP